MEILLGSLNVLDAFLNAFEGFSLGFLGLLNFADNVKRFLALLTWFNILAP
jgi:hypothetical protein